MTEPCDDCKFVQPVICVAAGQPGNTALVQAAQTDHEDCVSALIAMVEDVNKPSEDELLPLVEAARRDV